MSHDTEQVTDDALNRRAAELTGMNLEPATDHGDALRLLEFAVAIRGVSRGEAMSDSGAVNFRMYRDKSHIVEWSVWRGPNGFVEADTLPLAITRACIAALEAVRKEKGT